MGIAGFIVENFDSILKPGKTLSQIQVQEGNQSQNTAKTKRIDAC